MTWYEIFPQVLNMSLTASVIICFVLLGRLLLKRAPKIYSYVLWSVVLFRLLCPVSLSAPFSLLGILDTPIVESEKEDGKDVVKTSTVEYIPSNIVHEKYPEVSIPIPGISDAVNEKLPQGWVQTTFDPLEAPVTIATYLWMFGMLGLFGYGAASYFKLREKLVGALQLRGNIYLADHIQSPFVMGILRPGIYLPSDLGEQEKQYIILHEKHHISRLDPVFKMLAFLALCIHWFNPLVWAAFVLSSKDMEMSCDEAVVKKLGEEIRADYAASLLQLATGKRFIFSTPLAFGEGEPAGRIKNLARFKRPTILITLLAVFVCLIGIVSCALNPAAESDTLKFVKQETPASNHQAKYEVELGNRVMSGAVYAEQWSNGTCVQSAPVTLTQDVEEIQIRLKERREEGKIVGTDIWIDTDESGGSLNTYFAFPEENSITGWAFNAYEEDEVVKVAPEEEKILAVMSFDLGEGVRVFDPETWVKEPERLEQASYMIVVRADFSAEEIGETGETKEEAVSQPVEALQLQDVIRFSEKGYDLSWKDFENFEFVETGFGLYIRVYEIDETFTLMIGGGNPDDDPMYIYLTAGEDGANRIDIRDGGVEAFIEANRKEAVLEEGLTADASGNAGDLLYREYANGVSMTEGMRVCISNSVVEEAVSEPKSILIVFNGKEHREMLYQNKDLEFEISKTGNYEFFAVGRDNNKVDITEAVSVSVPAGKGVVPLE